MKASDLLVKALENEGVKFIFGLPGEENLDLVESLRHSQIKLILTRHEQAAGFMAATYGRLTGRPGVCLSTLGPGATNFVTAAAYANLGAMPMVMITGQKPIKKSKQGRFQIVDVVEVLRPLTKSAKTIVDAVRIPSLVRDAFRVAAEERPGAVLLELPEDIARESVDGDIFPVSHARRPAPDDQAVAAACAMLQAAKHPLLVIGAGANRKRTHEALKAFSGKTKIPFFTTQMGMGVLDSRAEGSLGAAALSDTELVHKAVAAADLVIVVGHDVVEKPPFLMHRDGAHVIHVNFSSAEVDDVYFPQLEVVGDIAATIHKLTNHVEPQSHWDFAPILDLAKKKAELVKLGGDSKHFPLLPTRVVADVRQVMPSDGIVCLDNGMYKLWFVRNYPVHQANTLLLDNALATMGAGLPSAMAAKLIHPDRKVLAVCGDGGFMMNSQEIETAVRLGLNLVVMVLNDSGYGMIKWKQKAMNFPDYGLDFGNPDFVAYARAYGAHGHRVGYHGELLPLLQKCLAEPGVHIIDVPVDYNSANPLLSGGNLSAQNDTAPAVDKDKQTATPARLLVHSPFDGKQLGDLAINTRQDAEKALATARALFDNRSSWLPAHKRITIFERLAELMEKAKADLVSTALSEGGKPYQDTVVEVDRAIQGVKLGIQAVHSLHGEQVPMGLTPSSAGRLANTTMEPIGVVVSLSAFNHPLNLIVHQTIPAIAAGCPVIIKPAAATPLSCVKLVELLHQAGLPKEWCQVLHLSNPDAEFLATDSRVGYLSFIGSAKVGWYLRSKLAPGTRCALEHGGAAPMIVDESADLSEVVPALAKGGFYHAGQVCVSVQRVYVQENILDALQSPLVAKVSALKVGSPADPATEVGPLIRKGEVDRVHDWVEEALKAGAKLLCGGKRVSETCYEPTILLNPPDNVRISKEEVFGPVVCLYTYNGMDEAIRRANSIPYAFQAAVFTKNIDQAMKAANQLCASAVMVNDHTAFRVDWMPFSGWNASGIGVGGILHSAREMSREKLIVIKSSSLA